MDSISPFDHCVGEVLQTFERLRSGVDQLSDCGALTNEEDDQASLAQAIRTVNKILLIAELRVAEELERCAF